MFTHTRYDFLKMIAASVMALSPAGKFATTAFAQAKEPRPEGSITVRVTAADKRYALVDPLRWRRASGKAGTNTIVILPARKQQPILGFGAALTDAACYMINQITEADRDKLLRELFDHKEMGFSVCRLAIGSRSEESTRLNSSHLGISY